MQLGGRCGINQGMNRYVPAVLLCIIMVSPAFATEIMAFSGCELVCRKTAVSRDLSCIRLDRGKSAPCRIQGMAGGEHISRIRILAGSAGWVRIGFKVIVGTPQLQIQTGEAMGDDTGGIVVQANDGIIEVLVSAHPYGEYELEITGAGPGGSLP